MDKYKKKSNKSSIVRIIISNFDMKDIKEIKVLYKKYAGVDTLLLKHEPLDITNFEVNKFSPIIFTDVKERKRKDNPARENINLDCKILDNKIVVKKVNNGNIIKNYEIVGKYKKTESDDIFVVLNLRDINNGCRDENRRRVETFTQRKMLSNEVCKNYAMIANCLPDEIDSLKIYKINRFLEYRSNMLFYYMIINYFLTGNLNVEYFEDDEKDNKDIEKEIWKLEKMDKDKRDECIKSITETLGKNISQFIENYENRIKNQERSDKNNKNKKYEEIKEEDKISKEKILKYLNKDIEKIIELLSIVRHKIMHYDYLFFERLFTGDKSPESNEIAQLLNLEFFKELSKIKLAYLNEKLNYLSKDDEIKILGKDKNAQEIYNLYNNIDDNRNGFNNYVNSFLTEDGEEIKEIKNLIVDDFKEELKEIEKEIENLSLKKEENIKDIKKLERNIDKLKKKEIRYRNFLEIINKKVSNEKELNIKNIYFLDINDCRKYKDRYLEHKDKVREQSEWLEKPKDFERKDILRRLNTELTELKRKMEEITKTNSLLRLQYKMKIAFGMLQKEYNLKIDNVDFLNLEKLKKEEKIEKVKDYLNVAIEDEDSFENLEKFIENGKQEDLFSNDESNNLLKFYILMYLLLPREIKSDFLGFVKRDYYQMKNIDFIAENNSDNDIIYSEKDKFFHNLRRFEKNNKNFEIFAYDLDFLNEKENKDESSFNKFYSKARINGAEVIDKKDIFKKNIIVSLVKYYEHIFKLCNDIEIAMLLKFAENKNVRNLKDICNDENISQNGYLSFSKLATFLNDEKELDNLTKFRNKIAHVNYKELFTDVLNNKGSIINFEKALLEDVQKIGNKINLSVLDRNFLNDFYMKKEKMYFNMRKFIAEEGKKEKTAEEHLKKEKKIENLLLKYRIKKPDNDKKWVQFLKNILNKIEIMESAIEKVKEKSKDRNLDITLTTEELNVIRINIDKKKANNKKNNKNQNDKNGNESIVINNIKYAVKHQKYYLKNLENSLSLLKGYYKKIAITVLKQNMVDTVVTKSNRKSLAFRLYDKIKKDSNGNILPRNYKKLSFEFFSDNLELYINSKFETSEKTGKIYSDDNNIVVEYRFDNKIFMIKAYLKEDSKKVMYHQEIDIENKKMVVYESFNCAKQFINEELKRHKWDFKRWE